MEQAHEPLASRARFTRRLALNFLNAALIIGGSLLVGMAGYHFTCQLSWMDSFLNASMILSGMGPTSPISNDVGKLFAGLYALYSGLVLVLTSGLIIAPIAHRVLHKLHVRCE